MKQTTTLLGAFLMVAFFAACEGPKKEAPKEPQTKEVCTYTYDNASTGVFWKAFKHTAKSPVNGQFEGIEVTGAGSGESLEDIMNGVQFSIDVNSINSGDSARDVKIPKFFFMAMANTEMITGSVTKAENGKGMVMIKMNDVEQEVAMEYAMNGEELEMRCTIDVLNWDGAAAHASINDACEAKHTGADGEKKLWTEVEILVSTKPAKECKDVPVEG